MNVPRLFPEEHPSVDEGLAKDLASITNYSWGEPMLVIVTMHSPSETTRLNTTMHAIYILTKDAKGEAVAHGMKVGREFGEAGRTIIEQFAKMVREAYDLRGGTSFITKSYQLE